MQSECLFIIYLFILNILSEYSSGKKLLDFDLESSTRITRVTHVMIILLAIYGSL